MERNYSMDKDTVSRIINKSSSLKQKQQIKPTDIYVYFGDRRIDVNYFFNLINFVVYIFEVKVIKY